MSILDAFLKTAWADVSLNLVHFDWTWVKFKVHHKFFFTFFFPLMILSSFLDYLHLLTCFYVISSSKHGSKQPLRKEFSSCCFWTFTTLLLCISLCNLFFLQMIVKKFLLCVCLHPHACLHQCYPENLSEDYFYHITHTSYNSAPMQRKIQ